MCRNDFTAHRREAGEIRSTRARQLRLCARAASEILILAALIRVRAQRNNVTFTQHRTSACESA
jgi:hypothetical protein